MIQGTRCVGRTRFPGRCRGLGVWTFRGISWRPRARSHSSPFLGKATQPREHRTAAGRVRLRRTLTPGRTSRQRHAGAAMRGIGGRVRKLVANLEWFRAVSPGSVSPRLASCAPEVDSSVQSARWRSVGDQVHACSRAFRTRISRLRAKSAANSRKSAHNAVVKAKLESNSERQ